MHTHTPDGSCGAPSFRGLLSCPRCGSVGQPVPRETVARFAPDHLEALGAGEIRFCPDPRCSATYYSPTGAWVDKAVLPVRIGLKESEGPRPLCTCFGHSYESLAAEYRATGAISAVIEVGAQARAGACRCAETNPQGVCCLTEMRKAVLAVQNLPTHPPREPIEGCSTCADPSGCASCG